MILDKQYDILELSKLTIDELYVIAKRFKVDTLDKKKQVIIYEILDQQLNK
jgi:hypothetical protein